MYIDNVEEQKKFFFFYYSKKKDDYVSYTGVHHRCITPCEIEHPYYWSNVPFNKIHNNFKLRNDANAIGCFGCSLTFGSQLPNEETWPYLLGKKIKKNCLNFGVEGAGIDSIFLNIKACKKDYNFKKIIILLPGFNRRVARLYKNSIWFRWPVLPGNDTLWGDLLKPPTHIDLNINNNDFINVGKKTNLKIFKDKNNFYSKKILARLIKFCKKNFNSVYLSSWDKEVHEYLKTHFIEYLLPVFDYSGPKAKDNVHPTIYQYNKFVESIHEKL
jgi:hypothetical protein